VKLRTGRRNSRNLYLQLGDEPGSRDPCVGFMVDDGSAALVADAVTSPWHLNEIKISADARHENPAFPDPELLVIVPSRGRPQHLARMVEAWHTTGAFTRAALLFAVDADDPEIGAYREAHKAFELLPVTLHVAARWRPMVAKLNYVAARHAETPFALGFAGDDHVPRTHGWAGRYLDELHELGTGIVYGDDGMQGGKLPTQWAMTSDIVRALGRMVPADVEHLYCDNAIMCLGTEATCLRYLPDVLIEHMHPMAGKAATDHGYARVNHPEQYSRDQEAFLRWTASPMPEQVAAVRALRDR
jgi:hypothetical protein